MSIPSPHSSYIHETNFDPGYQGQVRTLVKTKMSFPASKTAVLPRDFSTSAFSQIDWSEVELSPALAEKCIIKISIVFMEGIWQLYDKERRMDEIMSKWYNNRRRQTNKSVLLWYNSTGNLFIFISLIFPSITTISHLFWCCYSHVETVSLLQILSVTVYTDRLGR